MLRLEIARKTVAAEAGPRVVLEGVQVALDAGEIVALTGPSGCGKTTTLRIIAGLDRHYAGTMAWRDGAPARIGTVFQEPRLLPWRTVLENIAFVRPPDPDGVPALLETLGLAGVGGLFPRALSGGMARRVALARALAAEPELLLLDEPFVSLDPVSADACRAALLAFWRARACSILLVTHDLGEAAALADRIVLLPSARSVVIPPDQRRRGLDEGARLAARLI